MYLRSMRLCCVMFVLGVPAVWAQAPVEAPVAFPTGPGSALGEQVAAITVEPSVVRAHWGIAVTAMDGTAVYGLNEGEFFRPASNAKLFTTAAAMHLMGPDLRLGTTAAFDVDARTDRTVKGNLTLRGAGDANLSGREFPYRSPAERKQRAAIAAGQGLTPVAVQPLRALDLMAESIAASGVKHITGDVVGDDTIWPWEPYANDWTIEDAVWGYGAPVSALTVLDNQLELKVIPAAVAGKAATATLTPETGYYQMQVSVQTIAEKKQASIRIDRDIGSRVFRVVGTVAVDDPYSTEVAIEDPAEFAAKALQQALEAHGVRVDGKGVARHRMPVDAEGFSTESHMPIPTLPKSPVELTTLAGCTGMCSAAASLASQTMADDMALTLKVSQNLHAEILLHRLGKMYGTDGSAVQGARVVRQFLLNAGVDGEDFMFYDGSGLSGHDLVTPRATVKLLSYASQQPWFAVWKAGLPVGGEDGTLASRFGKPPLKDHLFAKTGTLSEARALSGYVDCASGKTVIFSVMVDNHAPNTGAERDAMDRIVEVIAANN